jgi:hypothetical protein
MINAIDEAEKSTKNVSFEAFASNYEKINSVTFRLAKARRRVRL